jgi:mannitol/fructose-specific phosphotransferase system IIA component (Ntr-type)
VGRLSEERNNPIQKVLDDCPLAAGLPAGFDLNLMVPKIQSLDRMGAIKELVDRLHSTGFVTGSLPFLQSVLDREHLESTVMADGIAFPHARCRSAANLGLAFGLSENGVSFGSDKFPGKVRIIALLAVPVIGEVPYIPLLSKLAGLFHHREFKSSLLSCGTPEEMAGCLSRNMHRKFFDEFTPTFGGGL